MTLAAIVVTVIIFTAVVAPLLGAALWRRESARVGRRLDVPEPVSTPVNAAPFLYRDLDGLPAPVARYFRFALAEGQPVALRVRLEQTGDFAIRPGIWRPFTAIETFSANPRGFLWDAEIRMAPLIVIRVRDSYAEGSGTLNARIAGLLPVAHAGDTPEMNSGELMRYLAELVWLPTALLPREGVAWDAIDDSTATVSLRDGRTNVSLTVHFGAQGEIIAVSGMRHRNLGGIPVLTPWAGQFADYRRESGMMIPSVGTAAWMIDGRQTPYWRGQILRADYRFRIPKLAP